MKSNTTTIEFFKTANGRLIVFVDKLRAGFCFGVTVDDEPMRFKGGFRSPEQASRVAHALTAHG
jgi:hypothetical protein